MRALARCVALVLALACAGTGCDAPPPQPSTTAQTLQRILTRERDYQLSIDPVRSSFVGERRWNDKWPDLAPGALAERQAHVKDVLADLDRIDTAALTDADRLDYELFRQQRQLELEELDLRWYLLPVRHNVGIHLASQIPRHLRFRTAEDYEDWLARMQAFPVYMDQTIALMRNGIRTGMTYPADAMRRVPGIVERQLSQDVTDSGFYEPFRHIPDGVPDADGLRSRAKDIIAASVMPAMQRFHDFFVNDYLPACTEAIGAWRWPRGDEIYAHFIRRNTTLDLPPEAVHQRGLDEVARIRARMEAAISRTGFQGSFEEFTHFLRTDPRFYYPSSEELLAAYRALGKQVDPLLVTLFRTLPRMPYGIEPVPEASARDTVAGSYSRGTTDGTRAGTVYINVWQPSARPKYEMATLILHEGVPGHHIQRSLALEQDDLPDFRRYLRSPVFSEGWALYAESLGYDIGLFDDPYAEFGALSGEMWRAVRLVVDTGIHWGRWDRERAVAYFKANTARPVSDIEQEIDRYAEIPGQALAYKIGEMKIKELRARAAEALGADFDLREFHDVVLEQGTIPLQPLERHVDEWLASHAER